MSLGFAHTTRTPTSATRKAASESGTRTVFGEIFNFGFASLWRLSSGTLWRVSPQSRIASRAQNFRRNADWQSGEYAQFWHPGETPDGGEDWDDPRLDDRSQTWDSWQDSGLDLYKSGEETPLDLEEREDLDELAREIYEYAIENASKIYHIER